MNPSGWRRATRADLPALELFLRSREKLAVGFIARILREGRLRLPNPLRGGLWICEKAEGELSGALLSSPARVYFPQLPEEKDEDASLARILGREGGRAASIIGPEASTLRLEALLEVEPLVAVPYKLMLKAEPGLKPASAARPAELLVAPAGPAELEALLPLQTAYELEEVVTSIHRFDPVGCRAALAKSLVEQRLVAATLAGRLVGKAGTNARSFSLDQVGGVYVLPELRGKGIGRALMEELLGIIEEAGKRAVLFVKARNLPAQALYRSLGFEDIGDFRADYFEA